MLTNYPIGGTSRVARVEDIWQMATLNDELVPFRWLCAVVWPCFRRHPVIYQQIQPTGNFLDQDLANNIKSHWPARNRKEADAELIRPCSNINYPFQENH